MSKKIRTAADYPLLDELTWMIISRLPKDPNDGRVFKRMEVEYPLAQTIAKKFVEDLEREIASRGGTMV